MEGRADLHAATEETAPVAGSKRKATGAPVRSSTRRATQSAVPTQAGPSSLPAERFEDLDVQADTPANRKQLVSDARAKLREVITVDVAGLDKFGAVYQEILAEVDTEKEAKRFHNVRAMVPRKVAIWLGALFEGIPSKASMMRRTYLALVQSVRNTTDYAKMSSLKAPPGDEGSGAEAGRGGRERQEGGGRGDGKEDLS